MRPSIHVVIGMLLLVGVIACLKWLPPSPVATSSKPHDSTAVPAPASPSTSRAAPPAATATSPLVVDEIVREDIEKAVVTYSPDALPTFERFLASNEPDVREAARDGLARLGEKGGALLLRRATARMTDPDEIKRMQETADWLELPSALDGPMKRPKE